jgi:hypothetical protein
MAGAAREFRLAKALRFLEEARLPLGRDAPATASAMRAILRSA